MGAFPPEPGLKTLAIRLFFKLGYPILRYGMRIIMVLKYWGRERTVPPITNPLLFKSATQLAKDIREGKIKSVDVVRAYVDRISEIEPIINATVDRLFLSAMAEASEADSVVASKTHTIRELEERKPLLGVPFTVKILLNVKGERSTAGSELFRDVRAAEDSPSVALLRKAGGIVLATTNTAAFGMGFETNNFLHGKTRNPYNTSRTSGGSSGGEAALIAAGGSVFGLGNDLAGSVRLPSHFTGIFAHKPSVGLVPNLGVLPKPGPRVAKFLYTGPMCRYSDDLDTTMKILTSEYHVPMKFGHSVDFSKVKIYYMIQIDKCTIPEVDEEIVQALKTVIQHFKTNHGVQAKEVHFPLLTDANETVLHEFIDSLDESLESQLTSGKITNLKKKLEFLKWLFGKSTFTYGTLIALNLMKCPLFYHGDFERYRLTLRMLDEQFDHLLDDNTILIMPTFPVHAHYHGEMFHFLPSTCYMSIFNLLGHPVTQVPVGISRKGLPQGLQIVSRRNNDPLTIATARELDKAFGGWIPPGSI